MILLNFVKSILIFTIIISVGSLYSMSQFEKSDYVKRLEERINIMQAFINRQQELGHSNGKVQAAQAKIEELKNIIQETTGQI